MINILKTLIKALTKEEVKNYKVITARSHSKHDRKDIKLFDYYRHDKEYTDEFLAVELFGESNKNAFYRLKNKVNQDVNKSLFFLHSGQEPLARIQMFRELARQFEHRQLLELAFQYLNKADKQARKVNDYQSLIQIYRQIINLSHDYMVIDPEPYIDAKKSYEEKLKKLDDLDELIATIKYRINRSYNLGRRAKGVMKMLQQTIEEFSKDQDLLKDKNNQFKLYQAISSIMIQNQDYSNLATYVKETYDKFESNGWFNKENHEVKLRMLAYLINGHYKRGEYTTSLSFVNQLATEMEKYQKLFYKKYLVLYYNGLLLNYMNLDPQKGVYLVEYLKNKEPDIKGKKYPVLTLLNPAILYYYTNQIDKALDNLNQFFVHPNFKGLDTGFQLKAKLIELMMCYEANNLDVLDYKTDQFQKSYGDELKKDDFQKEKNFFELFEKMVENKVNVKEERAVKSEAKKIIKKYRKKEKGSDDLIPYDEWLEKNLELKPVKSSK